MGWMWTMSWMILWGNLMVDSCARAGMFGYLSVIDCATLVQVLVERSISVSAFDVWLHTF
jgi:hypothetical protein